MNLNRISLIALMLLFSYATNAQGIANYKAAIVQQILSHSLKTDKIDTSKNKVDVVVDYSTKRFERFSGVVGGFFSTGVEEIDSQFYNVLFKRFDKTAIDIMYIDQIKSVEGYASNVLEKESEFHNVLIVGKPAGVDWMQMEILNSLIAHKDNGTDGLAYLDAYKRYGKSTLMIPVIIVTKNLKNEKVLSVKQYVYKFRLETSDRFNSMKNTFLNRIYIGDLWRTMEH